MPLLLDVASSITNPLDGGTIHITDEIPGVANAGDADGEPCYVEWPDWMTRPNPVYGIAHSLDYGATIEVIQVGRAGFLTLVIPSCSKALFLLLRTDKNVGGHRIATLYHPSEPFTDPDDPDPVVLDVEYLAVQAEDEAWESDEPQSVTLKFYSHGGAS